MFLVPRKEIKIYPACYLKKKRDCMSLMIFFSFLKPVSLEPVEFGDETN